MGWTSKKIVILTITLPYMRKSIKKLISCVGGIDTENQNLIRLTDLPYSKGKTLRAWDIIRIRVKNSSSDPRQESFKVKSSSMRTIGKIKHQNRKSLIKTFISSSLDKLKNSNSSLGIIKIKNCSIQSKRSKKSKFQTDIFGNLATTDKYEKFELCATFSCKNTCNVCFENKHNMRFWYLPIIKEYHDKRLNSLDEAKQLLNTINNRKNEIILLGNLRRWPNIWILLNILF